MAAWMALTDWANDLSAPGLPTDWAFVDFRSLRPRALLGASIRGWVSCARSSSQDKRKMKAAVTLSGYRQWQRSAAAACLAAARAKRALAVRARRGLVGGWSAWLGRVQHLRRHRRRLSAAASSHNHFLLDTHYACLAAAVALGKAGRFASRRAVSRAVASWRGFVVLCRAGHRRCATAQSFSLRFRANLFFSAWARHCATEARLRAGAVASRARRRRRALAEWALWSVQEKLLRLRVCQGLNVLKRRRAFMH